MSSDSLPDQCLLVGRSAAAHRVVAGPRVRIPHAGRGVWGGQVMPKSETHRILCALVAGRDPRSTQLLPGGSILHTPDVLRALLLAVSALEAAAARERRRAALPPNVGREWTHSEDAALRLELAGEVPISAIASRHGRSIRAIELRVRKMGLEGG